MSCFFFCFIPVLHIRSLCYYHLFFFFCLIFIVCSPSLKSIANHFNHSNAFNFCSISVYSAIISFLYSPWHNLQPDCIYLSTLSDPVWLLLSGTGRKRTFIPMVLDINLMTSMNNKKAFDILRQSYTILFFFFNFPESFLAILSKNVFPLTQSKWVQSPCNSLQDSASFLNSSSKAFPLYTLWSRKSDLSIVPQTHCSMHTWLFCQAWVAFIKICAWLTSSIREGNGTPLQYSCLANPMDGRAW